MQPLTTIQSQVLSGLLSGLPIAAVARDNGIDRSTIYHWRKDHPHFTFALDQARARLQTALYDDVQDLVSQALEVLSELLHSADDRIRLRVAQTLLRAANPLANPVVNALANSPAKPMKPNETPHIHEAVGTPSAHLATAIAALDQAEAEFLARRHSSTPRSSPTESSTPPPPSPRTPNRNQRCPCNSGIKYKKCCGNPARPAASPMNPAAKPAAAA